MPSRISDASSASSRDHRETFSAQKQSAARTCRRSHAAATCSECSKLSQKQLPWDRQAVMAFIYLTLACIGTPPTRNKSSASSRTVNFMALLVQCTCSSRHVPLHHIPKHELKESQGSTHESDTVTSSDQEERDRLRESYQNQHKKILEVAQEQEVCACSCVGLMCDFGS